MWYDLLPIALLGGILGLDVVSFPQAMISRPLVAATLGGALFGHVEGGLLVGATLELIALETLPVGASRYPEWGSAATVGGALYVSNSAHPAGALVVAVLASLATAWIGGWTMVRLRHFNARAAARRRPAIDAGARGSVIGLQVLGLTADFVRAIVLTVLAYAAFSPLAEAVLGLWTVDARLSRAIVVAIAATVGGAAVWKVFHAASGARWLFVGGLAVGFALMLLR
ncbi:MAG: phosphotransferase system sorbose-specific subunit [Gemmatimonadetes bacterium]|nr:phosphotransferase system sorbose-specific subunit [Gemmatimonadota bacterium]